MDSILTLNEDKSIQEIKLPENFEDLKFQLENGSHVSFQQMTYGSNDYTREDIFELIKSQYPEGIKDVFVLRKDEDEEE